MSTTDRFRRYEDVMDRISTDKPTILLEGYENYALWEIGFFDYASKFSSEFNHYIKTGETECFGATPSELADFSELFEYRLEVLIRGWVSTEIGYSIGRMNNTPIEKLAWLERYYGDLPADAFLDILNRRYPFTIEGTAANYACAPIFRKFALGRMGLKPWRTCKKKYIMSLILLELEPIQLLELKLYLRLRKLLNML